VDLVTDGVLVNSTVGSSFASSPTNYVGGSSPGTQNHPGNIAEVVVVATAVDTATRQRIEGYLAHKWGLEANLPVDHPYKDAPPTI
jgi:hypothetical protein